MPPGDDTETIKNDDIFPGIQRMAKLWMFARICSKLKMDWHRWILSRKNLKLEAVSEIGHNEIYGADLYSAVPSTKLDWIPSLNLLMASGSHSCPSRISGNIKFWDIRNLSLDGSWNCLGDSRKLANVKKEGFGCKIESHGNQVFCSKAVELELWSEVLMSSSTTTSKNGKEERVFKNILGRSKDIGETRITNLAIGGNKMFITTKDQKCVEVWQSSVRRS
ncbi:hypothetical protein Tco_0921685 [Tanacetum coccineum]